MPKEYWILSHVFVYVELISTMMSSYFLSVRLHLSLFQDVGILINGSVPDLAGSRVECEYGPGVSTAATVHLGYSFAQIQTCPLLPRENYQSILPGAGETEPIWLCTSHYLSTQYKYSYSVGFSFFLYGRCWAVSEQM